jgi:hypothetical protein
MGKKDKKEKDKKEKIKKTAAAATVSVSTAETMVRMRDLAEKYPWFDSAVIASAVGGADALPVHILLRKNSHPSLVLHRESIAEPAAGTLVADGVAADKPAAGMLVADEPAAGESANNNEPPVNGSAAGESSAGESADDELPADDAPPADGPAACEPVSPESDCGEFKLSTIDIIDDFVGKGEHRVVATDSTPEFIPEAAAEDDIPEDDELVTEELAEVYLNQGLFDRAKSIYTRLSLLYPKKSIYFAEIIEKIGSTESAAESCAVADTNK